jgi:predicted nucleic acid-binding protein
MKKRDYSLVISDYVLDETITALFKSAKFGDAVRFIQSLINATNSGQIVLKRIDEERFNSSWMLRRIYRDKSDISFTDLTSFVVMKELGITMAFTGDLHFEQVGLGFEIVPKMRIFKQR